MEFPRRVLRLKLGGALLTALGLVIGFVQFSHTYSQSVRQPFLEAQTKQCFAAAEHAARIATTREGETWKNSREEFWMLYWGPLAIVENVGSGQVASTMYTFGEELKKLEAQSEVSLPVEGLTGPAIAVAHACRDLLISKWDDGVFGWVRAGDRR